MSLPFCKTLISKIEKATCGDFFFLAKINAC